MNKLHIRLEQSADIASITRVTELAFKDHPHSDQTEHFIILALRRADELSLSLVAERDGQVVGHIAFSPVQFSDGSSHWYGLGPVAVLPELQQLGIGKALIERGLADLRAIGAEGCVLLGDPNYYGRFGFKSRTDCVYEGVPQEYFQSLTFGQHSAVGRVTYHEAFNAKA
ncbi:MAG: N-acetyltransferase [Pseudomonadota bacterium]